MDSDQQIWQTWAEALRSRGWNHSAAAWLEAAGPLSLVGAQLVYLGQPVLQGIISPPYLEALSRILEDPRRAREFIHLLKES